MTGSLDSGLIAGADREMILRALAKCKHARRYGWRGGIVSCIARHKADPEAVWEHRTADYLDVLRFIYRAQLTWPIGIYEPPISRVTGKQMGICQQTRLPDGSIVGAQDQHDNPVWRRWDGHVPSPFSPECCV